LYGYGYVPDSLGKGRGGVSAAEWEALAKPVPYDGSHYSGKGSGMYDVLDLIQLIGPIIMLFFAGVFVGILLSRRR
jgi:hypothetical protein